MLIVVCLSVVCLSSPKKTFFVQPLLGVPFDSS